MSRLSAGGPRLLVPGGWRLEQLDGVAGGVIQQDLLATKPGHDVVAELRPRVAQGLDLAVKVVDLELDAVPAARLGPATIRHGLGGPAGSARSVHQQPKVAAREHGEAGGGMQLEGEAEPLGVEHDRRIDIVDDVADADSGHRSASLRPAINSRHGTSWPPRSSPREPGPSSRHPRPFR
jgi:hypothetical protein